MGRVVPASRGGTVCRVIFSVRLHGKLAAGTTFKFTREILAANCSGFGFQKTMRLLQQFSLFSCLILQFQCFLYLYIAYNQHVNKQLIAYYAAKRSKIRRRERHIHLRKLMRKKRSRWVNSGRTDLW